MSNDDPDGEPGWESGGENRPADADRWVEEWIDLFDDPPEPAAHPPEPEPPRPAPGDHLGPVVPPPRPAVDAGPPPPLPPPPPSGDPTRWPARPPGSRPDPRWSADDPGPVAGGDDRDDPDRWSSDVDGPATIEAWQRAQERSRRQAQLRANQRAARQMQELLPGHASGEFAVTVDGSHQGSVRRLGLVAGALLAIVVGLIGYLFIGLGSVESRGDDATAAPDRASELGLPVGADVAPATLEELTLSTVQLVGLDEDQVAQCAGSGVIVSSDGTILTNAHVVTGGTAPDSCRFTTIGVGVTVDSSTEPQLLYRSEVVLLEPGIDLAVLRITGPLDDVDAPWPASFTPAPLGDSDTVELGDPVRVLGYPVIGGETITLTTGTVSGFTSQVGLGSRALIKTDATISAGNSGGLAVDADGRVIGIPTKARASERGPAVDCRAVSDTNGDGVVGEDDGCVSVGGFLNGIRPINLSLPLLAAAGVSDTNPGPGDDGDDRSGFDVTMVALYNPRFAADQGAQGATVQEVVTASAGIPRLCFFVDWEGIPLGTGWDGVWYHDNEIQLDASSIGQVWDEARSGEAFGVCLEAEDPEAGLPAGIREIAFYLDGSLMFVEGIEITAAPVEVVPITWTNATDVDLCSLAINPQAESNQLGIDELPPGAVIPPGGAWVTELPAASRIVVEAADCNNEPVASRPDGLNIVEADVYEIGR